MPRRRREVHDLERPTSTRRTPRRRRNTTPWLQRNALSVAAVSILIALLGLGFGLLQMLNHPEAPPQAMVPISAPDTTGTTLTAASTGAVTPLTTVNAAAIATVPTPPATREITANVKVLEPNYTVAAGDTLGQIAARFNTTVDRIQALNNLSDPRALRIGTRLVVPPPF